MSRKDKLIEAIKNNPKNIKFEELRKFLKVWDIRLSIEVVVIMFLQKKILSL